MRKTLFIICALIYGAMAYASSNGGVRHMQPLRVPVILTNYSDVKFSNTDYTAYKSSIEKYFKDNSYGKYMPVFDIIGPVTLSGSRRDYGANDYDGEDQAAEAMVAEACNLAEDLADFTQYDQDGDGHLDAVVIIYAGEGERYDNNMQDAVWEFTDNLETTPALDYLVELDGKTVASCCAVPELQSKTKRDGIGTLVHEFAHVLGLPNFGSTDGLTVKTLGDWDVMDHGCYNNSGNTPAAMSAYERFYLGWVEPILLDGPMNVRLRDLNTSGDCAIITASGQSNLNGISPDPTKFYILENRQQTGWDQYLPGHGLMLTYIDYVKNKWASDEVNNIERHPCVDLIEADGSAPKYRTDLLTNGYFGKQGDLFPSGATEYQMFSNKMYFSSVKEQGGIVTFDFNGGVDKCTVNFSISDTYGTCATKSLTESKKGAGVKLPAVTAKSGYTFLGWATTKKSHAADAGQPGEIFYPMSDCSVFAVMQDNTKYWVHYDNLKGVEIGDYIGFNGAYIKVADVKDITVTFVKREGYATPIAETCPVRVECGGKQLLNTVQYEADTIIVSIPAEAIKSDIHISITNVRKQTEAGCIPYSHIFTEECRTDTHADLSGYTWNVSIANDNTLSYDKNKGAVFGSGNYPAGNVKLYTEETMGCGVAEVRVTASANGDGVLSVYVAGSEIGTEELDETTRTYTFLTQEPTSGIVEIRLANTMKAMYLKQIEINFKKIEETQVIEEDINYISSDTWQKAQKILVGGQLYILYNEHIYNILGTKIK